MEDNSSDFDTNSFMAALRAANAEDLKTRVVARTEEILKSHGFSDSQLKQIDIDVSDYINDKTGFNT